MNFKKSLINTLGSFTNSLGLYYPKLTEESLLNKAEEIYGLNDFGNDFFKEGLSKLLTSLQEEANLSTLGKLSFYHESLNLLSSRLALYNELKLSPSTFSTNIERPLIILGLPRTGSTILQTLLAQDPQFRTPLAWEYNLNPSPPYFDKSKNKKRIERTKNGIRNFKKLIPELDSIHPLEAELPQECTMGMAINFDSILFELKYCLPSYQKWYDQHDKLQTYYEHKMILKYLQKNIPTKKWLIKNPGHIGALKEIFEVYPDAQIVQTHRNVKKTIASTASLYYHVRKAFDYTTTRQSVGEEVIKVWANRLKNGLDYRKHHPEKESSFFDFDFADFMKEPINSIKKLYSYFNLELNTDVIKKMEVFLAENHRKKKGNHLYTLKDYHIKEISLETIFQDYTNRFIKDHKNYS